MQAWLQTCPVLLLPFFAVTGDHKDNFVKVSVPSQQAARVRQIREVDSLPYALPGMLWGGSTRTFTPTQVRRRKDLGGEKNR
jgi:hypothetical protein